MLLDAAVALSTLWLQAAPTFRNLMCVSDNPTIVLLYFLGCTPRFQSCLLEMIANRTEIRRMHLKLTLKEE